MNANEYYAAVFDKLEEGFEHSSFVLTGGKAAEARRIEQGRSPNDGKGYFGLAESKDSLRDLTIGRGLEVYIPTVGKDNQWIISILDYEIKFSDDTHLYRNQAAQSRLVKSDILPATRFIGEWLMSAGVPHSVDLTPSGGHFLFWVKKGTPEWDRLAAMGTLEEELEKAYAFRVDGNPRRDPPVGTEAGRVYSGLGKLWEYLSHMAIQRLPERGMTLPVTISDPYDQNFNMDITCYGYPAYMRSIRAPFSLHKKRQKLYPESTEMNDALLYTYEGGDGKKIIEGIDEEGVIEALWSHEAAARRGERFSGKIPVADSNLIRLIDEYESSRLYRMHRNFENQPDLNRQEAFWRAACTPGLDSEVADMLINPNPRALNPRHILRIVDEFGGKGWHPKHIANLLSDLYEQERGWEEDWFANPSRQRANFWVRNYYALREGI